MIRKSSFDELAAAVVLTFAGLGGAMICFIAIYEGRPVTAGSAALAAICIPAFVLSLHFIRSWSVLNRVSFACAVTGASILACVGAGFVPDNHLSVFAGFCLLIIPLCVVAVVSLRTDLAKLRADD